MRRERRVLVFPAGTEIGLEIHAALRYVPGVRLFGAGADVSNHARYAFPCYHVVPPVDAPGWEEALARLCEALAIHYVFPAHDDVVLALSREAARLPAAVIGSPADACEVTRSKSATYRRLQGHVPVPRLYPSTDAVAEYPVFVKPDRGNGSIGARRVDGPRQLVAALQETPDPIICEYLPGEEYTVDCFSDREAGLLFCGTRIRRRVRNGIAVNTRTVTRPDLMALADVIGGELGLRGAWFFQVKCDRAGRPTLLEVAPRIAGSMAAHRVRGVNFAWLSILEHERVPLRIMPNPGHVELDRALRNRYRHEVDFRVVYVDLDDTLLLDGRVNADLVRFVFHCLNRGKRIVLLTRHAGEVARTLERHRLAGIFDEVVHITDGSPKSSHIRPEGAILVDDSFSERAEVAGTLGIPTFDCSMIEMLVDEAEAADDE